MLYINNLLLLLKCSSLIKFSTEKNISFKAQNFINFIAFLIKIKKYYIFLKKNWVQKVS